MSGDASGSNSAQSFVPPGLSGQPAVVQKCAEMVQAFRDGKITKPIASTRIMGAIPTAFVEGGSGEQAAHAYLEILDQIEKERADAANRGGGGGGRGHTRTPSPNGGRRRTRSPSPHGSGGRRSRTRSGSPPRGGRHRSRSASPDDDSSSKRRRVDDSKLPWVVEDFLIEPTLRPELIQTRSQLLEFAKDHKHVLNTIVNSTRHISFPESEWMAIIKGRAVDLDKVITHQFSIAHEHQHTESIGGGVQLLFGSPSATKSVTTQAEWISAWSRAAEAIAFVFPHRRRELEDYRRYITDLFSSSGEHVHERIILLDRRLRNEAAGRRDLLLSDCREFSHWERSYLNDNGAAYLQFKPKAKDNGGKTGGSGGGGEKKSKEACRRFNDDRCPSNKATCRYAHICSRCKRNHPVSKCDRPAAIPE
ncbi:hypothetical protein B0H11DRAFT_2241977 [Mycena galericulata]|nr:hypothetical protein B0H11DRAFT_2241977 [Mycena galericulata]